MINYLIKAFFFHWNLLFLGAGIAAGIISGYADIVLPLVGAAELAYIALIGTNPHFQAAINNDNDQENPQISDDKVAELLSALKPEDRRKFEQLRDQCRKLRRITSSVKTGNEPEPEGLTAIQLDGINHLLWIYLNLLYSKNGLENFFKNTSIKDIESHIQRSIERLNAMGTEDNDTPNDAKRRKSLLDTIQTSDMRLKNYRRAMENYDFIGLELDRLYSKIASLAEMGINRQDSDFITSEIDVVSASVTQAEHAINELEFLTGFSLQKEEPPTLLEKEK